MKRIKLVCDICGAVDKHRGERWLSGHLSVSGTSPGVMYFDGSGDVDICAKCQRKPIGELVKLLHAGDVRAVRFE